jgi:hypothetical protein
MKKELEKVILTENPFNVDSIEGSEKTRILKVLHLSGNPHESMTLWSRLANRSDIPVDFSVAASHTEVREVMGDYDRIMVSSRSDLKKLADGGFDMEKASIMEIKARVNAREILELQCERNPESPSYIKDLDDGTKKIILCFNNIFTQDKVRWRRAIRIALASLPMEHLSKGPDIYVYNTMMRALTDTFNFDSDNIDSLGEEYLKSKVWGFSYLNDSSERNMSIDEGRYKRIILAIKRYIPGYEWATPEFTIFHEFGHFWLQSQCKIICKNNEKEIEADSDEYALKCYARLMDKYPFYITISEHEKNRGFEKMITMFLKGVKKTGLKGEKLYEKTASKIMKKLKWR